MKHYIYTPPHMMSFNHETTTLHWAHRRRRVQARGAGEEEAANKGVIPLLALVVRIGGCIVVVVGVVGVVLLVAAVDRLAALWVCVCVWLFLWWWV
jgi:hypothetical protein